MYSIKEVCILLGVTRQTLRNWKNSGILIPIKIGGKVYYTEEQLERLKKG